MKKLVLIIVFLFLARPVHPVVEYIVNYDYIVKELCENKAKPELQCNGKCHLMKDLAKASENENNDSKDKKSSSTSVYEVLFFENAFDLKITKPIFFSNKMVNSDYSDLYVYQNVSSFFHPPLV